MRRSAKSAKGVAATIIRRELQHCGARLSSLGLVVGPGGNISAKSGSRVYTKPSGFAFEELKARDYVGVDLASGEVVDGSLKPTSEIAMHLECYRRRDDIGAVVHAHPPTTIGLITAGAQLQAMTPDFAAYLDRVTTIPYVIPTGPELAQAIGDAVVGFNVVLMLNHGVLTVGRTLKEAFLRMQIVEDAARTQLAAHAFGGARFFTQAQQDEIRNLAAEAYRRGLLGGGR